MASFFLDANTIVSGLLFSGPEAQLLDLGAIGLVTLSTDEYVLREVRKALAKPVFGLDHATVHRLMALVSSRVAIQAEPEERLVAENLARLRDKKDVPVLVGFETSGCDYLVTGDHELLGASKKARRTREAIRTIKQSLRTSFGDETGNE